MAFCKNCGNQLKPQAKFCEACGTLVEEEKPVQPAGVTQGYPPPYQPPTPKVQQNTPAFNKKSNLPLIILSCVLAVVLIGGIVGIISLSGTIGDLKDENTQLVADKNQLTSDLNAANSIITGLNNDLSQANNEIDNLTGDLNDANDTIDGLNTDLAAANSSLNAANETIDDLNDENQELAADKSELAADLADANDTILSLNSIIDIMDANYNEILQFIYERFGQVEEDAKQFVTPYDENVEALVDWLVTPFDSGDWNKAWDDIKYMYYWVYNNIEYSYDSPLPILPLDLLAGGDLGWIREFWQYPVETIYFGTGDCEDQSLLLTSMINNYGAYAFCVGISNGELGHMAVFMFVEGGNLVILDSAGSYLTNSWGDIDTHRPVEQEINNWLNWWSSDIPGAEIDMLFDADDYWEFDGNDDFFDWYFG